MDLAGIVNLALQKLGTRTTVTAAELAANSSNEAIQANLAITQTRDELLRLAPWQCSRATDVLLYITSAPGTPENQSIPANQNHWTHGLPKPPWIYEYNYPIDCLRVLGIAPQINTGVTGTPIYPTTTSVGYTAMQPDGSANFDVATEVLLGATGATIINGGSGYAVGDWIMLAYGPATSAPIGYPAQFTVTSVSGTAITGVTPAYGIYGEDTPQSGGYFFHPGVLAQGQTSGSGSGATFRVALNGGYNQRVILTNQQYAVVNYIRRIEDTNTMDPLFIKAWYHALASTLAMSLTADKNLANGLIQITNACIVEARAADGNEALTVMDSTPDWLRCRGYAASGAWNMGTGFGWDSIGMWPGY